MAKPIRRYSSYSLRRNRPTRLRKNIRQIRKGIIPVQAIFSNTIVTITNGRGRVVVWASASSGASGEFTGRPGADDRGSEKGLRDFQTESEGSETEIDNACAGNADCGKDWHQEPLDGKGKKYFWRMIGREFRSLLSLLLSLLRLSSLGWWKSFLWRLLHGTIYYLTYHTRYVLPLLLIEDFFEAIWESVKDFNFTLDSVSFRKRIQKFIEVYSILQFKSHNRIKSIYSNTPQPPIRLRVFNYMKFILIFLKEYKTYSGLFSQNKLTDILLRIVVCSVYGLFFSNRVAVLPQSIKIPIIIFSTLNFYLRLHSQFGERHF
uniref:ribosomal protein S11 n=1 Tax=Geranium thunbergii TaxID=345239 RepID=UPI00202946E0|nr:ribosomal protein S11 [Geranium thunbergii]UED15705.1 ribosomal protein S11 [Geranium thunbergii]